MIHEKEIMYNFDSKLIAEHIEENICFRIFENRIFHVSIPKNMKIGKEIIDIGYDFLNKNGGGRFYNVYEFDSFADVEPEVREWAADSSGNHYTYCDAIVIRNLAQKIIADFYIKFNKPKMPTKIFYSVNKAYEWIKEIQEEIET